MLDVISKFAKGLAKTKSGFVEGLSGVVRGRKIDEDVLDEIEEKLILGDVGVDTAEQIIDDLRKRVREEGTVDEQEVFDILKKDLAAVLKHVDSPPGFSARPHVISIVGVNGGGKTTTVGKLAARYKKEGKKVLVAAADTFRAAAGEQLDIWAERSGVDIISSQSGGDPAAVAFDALKAALARNVDLLLIDTAGRLHTKANLMAELAKIHRVMQKLSVDAPHEILLVIDAGTGQNGLSQARQFAAAAKVTGIVLTKLDGTAKGGIIFPIVRELGVPVRFVGLGEGIDDLEEFDADSFVEALFQ